jgi:hypothetical protein
MGKQKNVDCLKNFFSKDNQKAINDFKQFMKQKYNSGNISANHPKTWKSYNTQLNRIIAHYNNTGSQSRSGYDAWGKYLKDDLEDFIQYKIDLELQNLAREGGADNTYIAAGNFGGLISNVEIENGADLSGYGFRAGFTNDFEGLIRGAATYISDVPASLVIMCSTKIFIAKDSGASIFRYPTTTNYA